MNRALRGILLCVLLATASGSWAAMPSMRIEATAKAPDGAIVVAGQSTAADPTKTILVGRLNADGTTDTTFGLSGWASYADPAPGASEFAVSAIAIDPASGSITVAARHDGQIELLRFLSNGQLDYGFGYGGYLPDSSSTPAEQVSALRFELDGSLLAVGSVTGGSYSPSALLLHYLPSGYRDTFFGNAGNGESVYAFGSTDSALRAIAPAAAPDTGFYAVGYARSSAPDKAILLVKFQDDGAIDGSFSFDGVVQDANPGYDDEAFGVALDAAGRILVVGRDGYVFLGQPQSHMLLGRFNGAWPDYSFGYNGWRESPEVQDFSRFDDSDSTGVSVIEDASGALHVLGTSLQVSTVLDHFATWTFDPSTYAETGPNANPVEDTSDAMRAAYAAPNDEILALGTRDTAGAATGLRIRYFADDGSFDTDFPVEGADDGANPVSLSSVTEAEPAAQTDQSFRVSGIDVPVAISIAGGEYSLDCASFTSADGIVANGQRVCVRAFAATTPGTTTTTTVNIGPAVSATFTITTGDVPDTGLGSKPANPSGPNVTFWLGYLGHPATGYECSLDGAPFSSCGNGYVQYTVADGTHTFQGRALNGWGTDPTPVSYTWTAQVAPETTITSMPDAVSTTASPSFSFASSDPNATFRCKLDGGATTTCASPYGYSQQADGSHTFSVYAVSASGSADATPASYSWTIDAVPPDTQLDSFPAGLFGGYSNSSTAIFQFSSADPQLTGFECAMDGAAYSACASPISYTLQDGSHTFRVRAKSPGEVDPTPVAYTWTVDTVTPSVSITGGPTLSDSRAASFTFASDDPTASFFCWVDSGTITSCASPYSVTVASDGSHTIQVQAYDAANNHSAWASWQWTVDTTAPDTTVTSSPQGVVASTSASIAFGSNDAGASFECRLDGGAFASCASPMSYSDLSQGAHAFDVRAVDAVGNMDATPASVAWSVDTVAPETTIASGPYPITQSSDATFTLAANESGATFQCRLDGAAWSGCSASGVVFHNLAPGSHAFDAYAVDMAGNADPTPASQTWTIDYNYGPETTITGGPSGTVAQTQATFTFTSSVAGSTFDCAWDGMQAACASPFTVSGLTDGSHSFSVYAIDPYGNLDKSPAFVTWTVDTVTPDTSITSAPSGTVAQASATVSFASNDPAAGFECRLDGSAFAACASPASLSGLADGTHTFEVRAKDLAGNLDGSPASATWTVDTTAPNTTISGGPAANTNQSGATFQFSSGESGDSYQCSLDGAAFSACASPVSYAALADGAHVFQVRAVDPYGNADASPATWNWTVDTIAPDTSITSGPSGKNNSSTASFAFASTEANATFQCKLDAGSFVGCASPVTYPALARGSHTFSVRSVDVAGNVDASPAARSWSVK